MRDRRKEALKNVKHSQECQILWKAARDVGKRLKKARAECPAHKLLNMSDADLKKLPQTKDMSEQNIMEKLVGGNAECLRGGQI